MSKAEFTETNWFGGIVPTPFEKEGLDEAFLEMERDPSIGEPWRDVLRAIRESGR